MKKPRFAILTLTSLLLISSCISCAKPAYTPTGEIYGKTSPSQGDAGVSEVVDIEIEKASYPADGDITVPVKVGVGHHPSDRPDGDAYAYLTIRVWLDKYAEDEPDKVIRFDYPDWETAKFNSTEPQDRSFLFIPLYGDFYPLYRETVELTIPADVSFGLVCAELHEGNPQGNEYVTDSVKIEFERIDGNIVFSAM